MGYYVSQKPEKIEALGRNPLLNMIYMFSGIMDLFSAVIIHFMNFWGSEKVQEIANELLTLEYQDFSGRNSPKFNRYVIQKSLIVMGQLLSVLVVNYGMPGNRPSTFLMIFTCVIQVGINLNSIHYYAGVLFIYRYMSTINDKLQDLADLFKVSSLDNSPRIRELVSLYKRLLELNKKLISAYELQMTLMLTAFIVLAQFLSVLVLYYTMPQNGPSTFLVIFFCVIEMVMNLNNMHYYTGVLFIYRYVWSINGQLQDQADQLKDNPLENSSRIRELLCLYERLLELSRKLVAAYELPMTLMLTVGLLGNIVIIYFLIVFKISMGETSIFLMVFPHSLLINMYDFWLNIVVCELTENAGRKTSSVLKLFSTLEQEDVELERSLNEFAWLCSHRKFRFQLNGLFSINYKMGFQMIVTSFLYLIYLVQFDYMNL
ncbi:putative gustatory receptor 22b [Drosophila takahashii]|uniref:putative gustatory receptor 22b n=1 Tax=Drosophila takahashii TaxID=29030 RepID=UPI001CF90EFF|nr:putative gustatory receptor 22b [Drosophila takahashii]